MSDLDNECVKEMADYHETSVEDVSQSILQVGQLTL